MCYLFDAVSTWWCCGASSRRGRSMDDDPLPFSTSPTPTTAEAPPTTSSDGRYRRARRARTAQSKKQRGGGGRWQGCRVHGGPTGRALRTRRRLAPRRRPLPLRGGLGGAAAGAGGAAAARGAPSSTSAGGAAPPSRYRPSTGAGAVLARRVRRHGRRNKRHEPGYAPQQLSLRRRTKWPEIAAAWRAPARDVSPAGAAAAARRAVHGGGRCWTPARGPRLPCPTTRQSARAVGQLRDETGHSPDPRTGRRRLPREHREQDARLSPTLGGERGVRGVRGPGSSRGIGIGCARGDRPSVRSTHSRRRGLIPARPAAAQVPDLGATIAIQRARRTGRPQEAYGGRQTRTAPLQRPRRARLRRATST